MSTASRSDIRKPLLDAYLFERRILFGSTILVGAALIFWIVAISTDHWYIISVDKGSYVLAERRYFLYSNAGLWRICIYSSVPTPLPNATVARNFTFFQRKNVQELKTKVSKENYINEFINFNINTNNNIKNDENNKNDINKDQFQFDDKFKKQMFGFWVKEYKDEFDKYKKFHTETILKNNRINPYQINGTKIVETVPLDRLRYETNDQVIDIMVNNSMMYVVIPRNLKNALFSDWHKYQDIVWLLGTYAKDLGVSPRLFNLYKQNIIIRPPYPPKQGKGIANGYEYKLEKKCRYIDMFPSDEEVKNDLTIDEEILDYIRTQASFACITVIIMCMGCVFSGYTFSNPRYMFKRLAGGIHFISAATTLVVIQVLIGSVDYRETHLEYAYPKGAERTYGYGVYIAWFVFVSNLFASVMFMWYSKKKKGNKAPTDEIAMADEAINIGR